MKKNISNLSGIVLISLISLFTSCKKPDTKAPVITLNGATSLTTPLQTIYNDLGATANDNKDGAITPTTSGKVNINHTGTYTITYRATDAAGNIGIATRAVTVINEVASMTGYYQCAGSATYYDTIKASPIVNKIIDFGKFGNYAGNTNIHALVTGSTVKIVKLVGLIVTADTVLSIQVGNPPADRTFFGTGSIISATVFNLNFHEKKNGTDSTKVETFNKQ